MIKGILALFRSGLILNPMVMLGIFLGFTFMFTLDDYMLKAVYTNYSLYMLMFMVASAYVYFFKCVYINGGYKIDWKETFLSMVGHFFMLVISFVCSMLFVLVISFGESEEPSPEYAEFEKLQQEIKNQQQELQENYDAILKTYNIQ